MSLMFPKWMPGFRTCRRQLRERCLMETALKEARRNVKPGLYGRVVGTPLGTHRRWSVWIQAGLIPRVHRRQDALPRPGPWVRGEDP